MLYWIYLNYLITFLEREGPVLFQNLKNINLKVSKHFVLLETCPRSVDALRTSDLTGAHTKVRCIDDTFHRSNPVSPPSIIS